jgi:hypothetical protein
VKLYLASSWRNELQPLAVGLLRAAGHEVYDFRHPPRGDHLGFSWSEVDPRWRAWTAEEYLAGLEHPIAIAGFESDFDGMRWADAGVLLLPCGRSAHLEAGYFVGVGKPLYVVLEESEFGRDAGHAVAELMYRLADGIATDIAGVLDMLQAREGQTGRPCPVPSSVTDAPCLLPDGHPPDSASRFHRYAAPAAIGR